MRKVCFEKKEGEFCARERRAAKKSRRRKKFGKSEGAVGKKGRPWGRRDESMKITDCAVDSGDLWREGKSFREKMTTHHGKEKRRHSRNQELSAPLLVTEEEGDSEKGEGPGASNTIGSFGGG